MKKVILFALSSFIAINSALGNENERVNPFFGDYKRQVGLHVGTGVNSGFLVPPPSQFVPFALVHFQYSLPTTFFEIPARQSINVATTIGYDDKYGWKWQDYTIPLIFLSEDIVLLQGKKNNWYFGTGVGVGMQAQQNERIGSKLIFGFKLMFGFEVKEDTNLEIFMQHFSNGNTAPENNSYAFYGLGIVRKF